MALEDKIEAVKKVNKALSKQVQETELERLPPNKEKFDALLNSEEVNNKIQTRKIEESALTIEKTNSPSSLMEEVKKLNNQVNRIGQLGPEDLKNQARDIIVQMDQVKSQLSNVNNHIKPSYHNLLHNRLTHIDDNLKVALSKAGVEYNQIQQPVVSNSVNPIERFIGYLTHGQYQLEHLSQTIDHLGITGAQLSPANMLAMQIKVGQVQQEIELFTSLLNKALESTKTIMNVQV